MDSMEAQGTVDVIKERIKQRAENVATRAEERRALKDINMSATETIDFFYDNFSAMKEKIENLLENTKTIDSEKLSIHFDSLVQELQYLQQYVNESSFFLPSYQIKKSQEKIDILSQSIDSIIQEFNPKKKFGFRQKKTSQVKKQIIATDTIDSISDHLEKKAVLDNILKENFFGFRDLQDCELLKIDYKLKDRQINLQNLKNCKVIALGNPSSMQISNLEDCIVIIGPTSRSAFIKDCKGCRFAIACQQVRIHNTESCQFYLHVTGAAIIEGCHSLLFAPYNLSYPDLDRHYAESQLNLQINNWDKVEDFHWLNETEESPNFSLMSTNDMRVDWL